MQAIQDQKQALIEDLEQRVQLLTSEKEALEAATDQARKAAEDAAHAHKTEVYTNEYAMDPAELNIVMWLDHGSWS